MNRNNLQLDISLGRSAGTNSMDWQQSGEGSTYKDEGLSVGSDHMRLYGDEVQMEVLHSDLIFGERIGEGACSAVHVATHIRTGEKLAVKWFNVFDRNQGAQLFKELSFLTSVSCEAVITLKGAFHDQGRIGLIIEYMDKGSLEWLMDSEVNLTEEVMAAITFQIIWGLGYLHYEKQLHRDIKPANVLMNSKGHVKLSDFGISKELEETTAMSSTAVGSYRYMSPERLLGEKYDASGDIWSVGITIVQLWTKRYPLSDVSDSPIEILSEIESNIDSIVSERDFPSPRMREVLLSMLEYEPNQRATSQSIAGAEWFGDCGITDLRNAQQTVEDWLQNPPRRVESKSSRYHNSSHHHHHHHRSGK
jgi:serine/threonine protein kinase